MSEQFNLNNRYQFMGLIGKGRLGDVYRASDNFFRREVALKMIRKETTSPEFLQYFSTRYAQHVAMLSKMNNPSIIKTYDFTMLNGAPAWTMDLYSGASYAQYTGKPMPVEQAANLLIPVADALTYAHNYGMIHGNLKPGNILIDNNQNPVLTDFALTQWLSENGHGYGQFEANAGIGSPEYLSPEQAQGGMMDARSDVYSLGIMFYELVTGRRPFSALSPLETMAHQVNDQIQSPRYYVPNISQQAEQFIYQATAKNPAQRISSMSEIGILNDLHLPLREFRSLWIDRLIARRKIRQRVDIGVSEPHVFQFHHIRASCQVTQSLIVFGKQHHHQSKSRVSLNKEKHPTIEKREHRWHRAITSHHL